MGGRMMTEAHRGGTCMGDRPKDGRRLFATVLIDLLTLSRIPLAAVFCALSLAGESLASRVALFALIVLSDLFDGRLARRLAVQSALGAILDVTADLFFVTTAITTLCVLGLLPWWLLCVALLMFVEFVITSLAARRQRGERAMLWYDRVGRAVAVALYVMPLGVLVLHSVLRDSTYMAVIGVSCAVVTVLALASAALRVKEVLTSS